ncbi:uncharacterized protein FRV6_11826 [Fusarium oxysporum]|uniref:Zn(2)-C6 fungal-type domain-containing protein n=1 Tax=Fusarium oxysporum TaxID=5507 RepID=A0A2H3U0J9_FUSOX|nr:uncharacterized protein FRV6_11826 [Fusarium oxysporum]
MSTDASGQRPLRPLLPARSSPAPKLKALNNVRLPKRRPVVAAACEACRKRKSKCSGTRPKCSLCIQRASECVYSAGLEETRLQAMKRKYEELVNEQYRNLPLQQLFGQIKSMAMEEAIEMFRKIQAGDPIETLTNEIQPSDLLQLRKNESASYEEFYRLLQSRPEQDLGRILHLVRSGCDVEATLRYVREADLLLQISLKPEHRYRYEFPYNPKWPDYLRQGDNPYLTTPLYQSTELTGPSSPSFNDRSIFHVPYHGATLIEPLLTDVKISKWTNVTSDEALLTYLLELYLLHAYPFFTFFTKDLFLRDLKIGQTQFCSSLLVHAVLASATHYHPLLESRNKPWDTQSLSYRFFAETKRLWELEMGESKLTTLQAALVMNSIYNMDGLDQIGNVYLVQAAKIAHNLNLFSPTASEHTEMAKARQFTAWGLFSWQSTIHFHYCMPPLFEHPPDIELPDPSINPSVYDEIFVKYPQSDALDPVSFPWTFFWTAKFRIILNNLGRDLFYHRKVLSIKQATRYYHRLMQWFQGLPVCLQPSNLTLPHHLQLHIHVQYVIMLLFQPFVAKNLGDTCIPMLSGPERSIKQILQEAKGRFETILRVYYLRHSFVSYAPVMLQYLSVFGFVSTEDVKEAKSPSAAEDARSSLILATHGLESQARGAHLTNTVFRLIYKNLPNDVANTACKYFSLKTTEPGGQIQPSLIRSSYPVHMVRIDSDAEEIRLNNHLRQLQVSDSEALQK